MMESYLTASDLKNFAFCPLTVYFKKRGMEERRTEAMEEGELTDQEVVVNFVTPTLRPKEILRKPFLKWRDVSGVPDFVLKFDSSSSPLEVKSSPEQRRDHRLQLSLYCFLLEMNQERVRRGYIYYVRRRELYTMDFTAERRREVVRTLNSLRRVVREGAEEIRQPARKCMNCGFLTYCRPEIRGGVAYAGPVR
jgi:CRISPR-associated exonuclease Cas4